MEVERFGHCMEMVSAMYGTEQLEVLESTQKISTKSTSHLSEASCYPNVDSCLRLMPQFQYGTDA